MNELSEELSTVSNLVTIANILIEQGYQTELRSPLCTILELLHAETQAIIDDYCVVKCVIQTSNSTE